MNRSYAPVLAFLLSFVPVAAAQLSLPSVSAGPGASLIVSALFTPTADVSGLQFDLQYDSTAMSLTAIAGDALRIAGKSVYSQVLSPNEIRFLIVGLNQNAIPQGALLTFVINVNQSAPVGSYTLALSSLVSATPDGEGAPLSGENGSVDIQPVIQPPLQAAGIRNAASLDSGPVAPGEIITLIGAAIGPAIPVKPAASADSPELGGISVLFDGTPAPLLYAGPNQINAIVPYEVSGQDATQILVRSGGQTLAALSMPVAPAMPAIFTIDSSGVGPGAILNQDNSINSPLNPADRGSIVAIFATGTGQTNPPSVDGEISAGDLPGPAPLLPVSVQIGGKNADVIYSGAAPGLVAGVLQVNCRVPEDIAPGLVSVFLTVGTASSPAGVAMAVQ